MGPSVGLRNSGVCVDASRRTTVISQRHNAHVRPAELGVAEGVTEGVQGRVDVAQVVGQLPPDAVRVDRARIDRFHHH